MSASASPLSQYVPHGIDHPQGPPRKKMRKGTKSCIECRRRKIKCTFEPGRTSICNECAARGSTCIDQEHADLSLSAGTGAQGESASSLKERVNYLENLVQQVLHRLPGRDGQDPSADLQADTHAAAEALKSLKSPVKPPQFFAPEESEPTGFEDAEAPALTLFDNAVISRKRIPPTMSRAQYNKSRTIIAALLQLLPTPDDLEIVLEASQEWWAIWRTMFPNITDKRCSTIKESVSHTLRSEKPAEIAKIMLCIALSINQLPHEFDWSKLSLKGSRAELMEKYMTTVDNLILSDDEIAATIDGLECMILAAKYNINMGRPRRSWLLYHRAIAFGQLLGLHRLAVRRPKNPDAAYFRQLMVWTHLIMGDRYLSLILGLPYAVSERFIEASMSEAAKLAESTSAGESFLAKMCPLITNMIDRDQSPKEVPYSVTLDLDRDLEGLRAGTPPEWWGVERAPGTTVEEFFDKLQSQFFYFHAKVLLHMPFMLRSSSDKLYQHSHTATLEGAREMIRYFDTLREAENVAPHICKLLDFQAFTAAMILLLNLCGYNSHARDTAPQQPDLEQDQQDSHRIDRTIILLRKAAKEPGGIVASQCEKALEMLGMARTGICQEGTANTNKNTCSLAIPYFGTISIGMGKKFVPIKPGTYPEAGKSGDRLNVLPPKLQTDSNPNGSNLPPGLPTPNSLRENSYSSQPSPSHPLQQQVTYGQASQASESNTSSAQDWFVGSTNFNDPQITFDSFMAFPPIDFGDFAMGTPSNSYFPSDQRTGMTPTAQPNNTSMDGHIDPSLDGTMLNRNTFDTSYVPMDFPASMSTGSGMNAGIGMGPGLGTTGLELDNTWNWWGAEGFDMVR